MPRREALVRQLTGALRRSGLREATVRIALLPEKSGPAAPSIVVRPSIVPAASQYRAGLRVAIVPARKFSVGSISPQAKYSARLGSVLAVQDAQLRGVEEAVFLDAGTGSVTESTASNFGIVSRGSVLTPPYWLGLLAGITRDVLFELGVLTGIPVREALLTRHEVYNADEAFMTSTLKEVIGVTQVDGRRIGSGRPGPITKQLREAFQALVRREIGGR
jgi:branched-chain amino acid aminotransferase